jgi:hypothetical protein
MSVRIVATLALYCVVANSPSQTSYGVAAALGQETSSADDVERDENPAESDGEALTINDVMRYAMTQHLCKKVAKKEATAEEQQRLLSLFETLGSLEPPKGSAESWKEKTGALVTAAREIAEGEPSHSKLMKAANCSACHKEHRP